MRFTFWRRRPPRPQDVPDLEVSIRARQAAIEARDATLEALARRDEVKKRNHIAEDIGRAYLLAHRKA